MAKTRRVGKSLIEVESEFGTETQCLDFLEQARWLEGLKCLKCDSDRISKFTTTETTRKRIDKKSGEEIEVRVPSRRLYDCMACGHQFSTTTGTLFHDTHLPLTTWFKAIAILCNAKKGKSALELQRDLKIAYRTAWYLGHRIRKAMREGLGEAFTGTVEVDATFVGGRYDKRRKREPWQDKPAVAGIVQRNIEESHSKVAAIHVSGETRDVMMPLIEKRTAKDATVHTDESRAFLKLNEVRLHETVCHSRGEYVRGNVSTNAVENFWSLFKRGLLGSYHQVSIKHLQAYVDEFAYRFNNRENQELFAMTVLNLVIASALPYARLTAKSAKPVDSSEDVPF